MFNQLVMVHVHYIQACMRRWTEACVPMGTGACSVTMTATVRLTYMYIPCLQYHRGILEGGNQPPWCFQLILVQILSISTVHLTCFIPICLASLFTASTDPEEKPYCLYWSCEGGILPLRILLRRHTASSDPAEEAYSLYGSCRGGTLPLRILRRGHTDLGTITLFAFTLEHKHIVLPLVPNYIHPWYTGRFTIHIQGEITLTGNAPCHETDLFPWVFCMIWL